MGCHPELGADATTMKGSAALMHTGLHDCHCEIEDLIAENDRVAVRYTARATHVGELFGAHPSGRIVTITGIEIYRLTDGRIAEYWGEANMSELSTRTTSRRTRARRPPDPSHPQLHEISPPCPWLRPRGNGYVPDDHPLPRPALGIRETALRRRVIPAEVEDERS
ncbi:MAG: ester cyclase [Pseudonocardiaceae bacterium]